MFRTHSPYSPFFTSGLLSSSRPASPDVPISPTRRGSLPTDGPSSTRAPKQSAFYFTLEHEQDQLRSYLSLDLAESQSMRSASLKRKPSTATAASLKPFSFSPISEAPAMPLRVRFSRDSLRTIPSPKPAPSITLPEVPKAFTSTPPRLPSLLPLPALPLDLSLSAPSSAPSTSAHAPAVRTAPALTLNLAYNNHRASVATTSTVSTRARRHNRSEALARLEGRSGLRTAPLASYPKRNFMSMSDDEDEEEEEDIHAQDADDEIDFGNSNDDDLDSLHFPDMFTLHNPLLEPEDMVLPLPLTSPSYLEAPRSAPLPPPRSDSLPSHMKNKTGANLTVTPPTNLHLRRHRTKKRGSNDWFPLKSFIDLHADGADAAALNEVRNLNIKTSSWMWRSFIEVANVS